MVKIAVCGCGFLGSSIAGCLVFYGHDVVINDLNKLTLDRFPDELKKKKQQLQQSDLILDQPFSGTYHLEPDLEAAVRDVDFVIEAIQEDLGSKRAFFQRVSNACRTDTVLLTSTINLRLEDVFSLTSDKERTLGLRFLHPVYFVQDVEVRYHEKTSADVMDKVTRFVEEDLPKSLFMRRAGEEPLLLSETAITAMEEARREELRRQIQDPNIAMVNFSLEAQRDSFPSLGPDDDEDDEDMGGRPDNAVFGHGRAACNPKCPLGFSNQGPQPLRSLDTVTCPFCKLRPTMCVLSPCLHQICKECAKSLMNRGKSCPIQGCQRIINSYQTIGPGRI